MYTDVPMANETKVPRSVLHPSPVHKHRPKRTVYNF